MLNRTDKLREVFAKKRTAENTSWYRIENKGDSETEVYIYDEIGFWGVTADQFAKEFSDLKASRISVRINSPGGSYYDGLAIYNSIKRHSAHITTYVDGIAASAASFIAMAGDEVVMMNHSEMMIHDALTLAVGNADELRKVVDQLDRASDNIAAIYADKAGGNQEMWRALMKEETWFTPNEAATMGLADRVEKGDDDEGDTQTAAHRELCIVNFKYSSRAEAPDPLAAHPGQPTDDPDEDEDDFDDFEFDPEVFKDAISVATGETIEAYDPDEFRGILSDVANDAPAVTESKPVETVDDEDGDIDWSVFSSEIRRVVRE